MIHDRAEFEPPSRFELETYGLRTRCSNEVICARCHVFTENVDETCGLAVVLDRAEAMAIALLERAVARKDVSRRLVGIAGELLKTIDESRTLGAIAGGWQPRRMAR